MVEPAPTYSSDVAFTPSVKAIQSRKGSRPAYARMEERGSWQTRITPDLAAFIERQTSVFLATANTEAQPYIQHRGGPPGFLKVLDDRTIGFADFVGNKQYITHGNQRQFSNLIGICDEGITRGSARRIVVWLRHRGYCWRYRVLTETI